MNPQNYKLIIFDADGTLRRCTILNQPCPNRDGEWELIEGVKEKLQAYLEYGGLIGIASNQGGIALNYLTEHTAMKMLTDLYKEITGDEPAPGRIQICPHATRSNCKCRKPAPGMIDAIVEAAGLTDYDDVLFVGDMESDKHAAIRAGVNFVWAWDFFGWRK